MPNRCRTLTNSFAIKLLIFQCNFFSLLSYMLKNQAEFLKLDSIHQFMLPSKSCKTINANFLLKNFGLTFFDRFKTGTFLVNWFGRGSVVWPMPIPIHRSFTTFCKPSSLRSQIFFSPSIEFDSTLSVLVRLNFFIFSAAF